MKRFVKSLSLLTIMAFSSVTQVFAARDVTTRDVEQMDSWQEMFDINEKKPGKYNIVITANDKGGNTGLAGPFNIYIDPESDLPIAGITNPRENMRVQGNLNIVGTCIDDDGVDEVWLIFDGDKENPKKATGKEFWSYYLDTNDLAEGPHTIEVYGIDINEGDAKKTGHISKVSWNLDRRKPITEVTNHTLGELVSGKINLKGTIYDGNGIAALSYSFDGGVEFEPTKIGYDKKENIWTFDIPLDTRKFPDGPAVAWFKATDKMGSTAIYSYLYFIDNTKPDVKIESPKEGEVCNGIFGIAGFAKDVIGVSKLSWKFGNETGDFELIPGNPYFYKEIDTRGINAKATTFSVTAVDTLGNTVTLVKNIPLNQEDDKPVVTIETPEQNEVIDSDENGYYLSGIVNDDDGVASVTYKVDNGEEKTVETHGVFYVHLADKFLPYGNHKVTVYATDIHDVKGNPVVVNFVAKGNVPQIEADKTYGLEFHPEANPVYNVKITSDGGLNAVSYKIVGGQNLETETDVPITPNPKDNSYPKSIDLPISLSEAPWGLVTISVKATDIYGRTSTFDTLVNVKNITKIHTDIPRVVFDDSRIILTPSVDGSEAVALIKNEGAHPVHGYFINSSELGKMTKAELVPPTALATIEFNAETNIITLKSGVSGGISAPTKVRVTTDQNKVFESIPLMFEGEITAPAPEMSFDSDGKVFDLSNYIPSIVPTSTPSTENTETVEGETAQTETTEQTIEQTSTTENAVSNSDKIKVVGKVKSLSPLKSLKYRIYNATCSFNGGFVVQNTIKNFSSGELQDIRIPDGFEDEKTIEFEIPYSAFNDGVSVVEIVADNNKKTYSSFFVNKVRKAPKIAANGKPAPPPAKPEVRWVESIDGGEIYHASIYQGDDEVENGFAVHKRNEIKEAKHNYSEKINYAGAKEPFTSTFTVQGKSNAKIFITKVGDYTYFNGMKYSMPKDSTGVPIKVEIESDIPVLTMSYVVDGEKVPGGKAVSSGKVPVTKSESNERLYTAEFNMEIQPSRLSKIAVTAETELDKTTYKGTIAIVRDMSSAKICDETKIYWKPTDAIFDTNGEEKYILQKGFEFEGYANMYSPISISLVGNIPGVSIVENEVATSNEASENPTEENATNSNKDEAKKTNKKITLKFEKDGLYKNVAVKVKDALGNEFISPAINVLVDSKAPQIEIISPVPHIWIQNEVKFASKITDENGLVSSEYSLDEGETWTSFTPDGSEIVLSFANAPEGLRRIIVRATDISGRTSVDSVGIQRDITPPEVNVIVPASGDIINGENLIAFIVKDAGNLVKAEYLLKTKKTVQKTITETVGRRTVEKTIEEEVEESTVVDVPLAPMITTHVGTLDKPLEQTMIFRFTDESGNFTEVNVWEFIVDLQSDLPVASVHLPEDNAVLTRDFKISGIVTDDDGKSKIWWKIDDGEYKELPEYDNSFSIDIPIKSMTDNEHSVTVYAVDINGVKGEEFTRNFRISLEEPKGEVQTPPIEETVRGTVKLTGIATDENGIGKVYISVDNGNSYDEAIGNYSHEEKLCNWSYEFDTRVVQDGTHVVFLKIVDWYGIEGLYSSLINIDNTAPEIQLELPLDDSVTTGKLFFSGQTLDNIELTDLFITVRSLEGKVVSSDLAKTSLIPDKIITQVLDISTLEDGFYNIELTGTDAANNITRVSRNVKLDKTSPVAKVDLLYPLNGESVQSVFNVYGTATVADPRKIAELKLYSDGIVIADTQLSSSGYYKFTVNNEMMQNGLHNIKVIAYLDDGQTIESNQQYLIYNEYGPWITIDNFTYGDFAVDRPYIKGKAGYVVNPEEIEHAKLKTLSKRASIDAKEALAAKSIESIDISFNNGKTFQTLTEKAKGDWKFRVENEDIAEGFHFLLVRAKMKNGEVAVTRCIVQVDSTKPTIKLISPGVGGRYNQQLEFSGLAHDDIELKNLTLALRKGDKAAYEVPGFIQGLYFDTQFWGASLFSVGAGLSFFDDNVKLQVQFGQFTESQWNMFNTTKFRYGGNIMGMKLLANVYYLPFRSILGPDWDWLSMNVALGANFSHFSESGSGSDQILSAMLLQVEFPRVSRDKKVKMFRTFAFYTEGQFWFIPSDVSSADIPTLVPQISFGLRAYVF